MVRSCMGRWLRWGSMGLLMGLLTALLLVGCDGRSIGVEDPPVDGGTIPDVYVPVYPDVAVAPPDAAPSCEGSPVQGTWRGSFTGEVTSSLTGTVTVLGTVQLEIYCEETLQVHGVMEGSESSGVPFEAEVEGEFDEGEHLVWATWDGTVYVVPASGTLAGAFYDSPVERISGTWQGTAPEVTGTGSGQWQVTR